MIDAEADIDAIDANFLPDVRTAALDPKLADLLPRQRLTFALMVATFESLKKANSDWRKTVLKCTCPLYGRAGAG